MRSNDVYTNASDYDDIIDDTRVSVTDELFVEVGNDEDDVVFRNSGNMSVRVVDGGNDSDTLYHLSNFFDEVVDSVNFENIIETMFR